VIRRAVTGIQVHGRGRPNRILQLRIARSEPREAGSLSIALHEPRKLPVVHGKIARPTA